MKEVWILMLPKNVCDIDKKFLKSTILVNFIH